MVVVDESYRIRKHQLNAIVQHAVKKQRTVLFSYDTKQYLKDNETRNIHEYLVKNYPQNTSQLRKLTTKIRTNKKMASFIHNIMAIGSSKDNLDYSGEWKAITFISSQY